MKRNVSFYAEVRKGLPAAWGFGSKLHFRTCSHLGKRVAKLEWPCNDHAKPAKPLPSSPFNLKEFKSVNSADTPHLVPCSVTWSPLECHHLLTVKRCKAQCNSNLLKVSKSFGLVKIWDRKETLGWTKRLRFGRTKRIEKVRKGKIWSNHHLSWSCWSCWSLTSLLKIISSARAAAGVVSSRLRMLVPNMAKQTPNDSPWQCAEHTTCHTMLVHKGTIDIDSWIALQYFTIQTIHILCLSGQVWSLWHTTSRTSTTSS